MTSPIEYRVMQRELSAGVMDPVRGRQGEAATRRTAVTVSGIFVLTLIVTELVYFSLRADEGSKLSLGIIGTAFATCGALAMWMLASRERGRRVAIAVSLQIAAVLLLLEVTVTWLKVAHLV